MKYKVGIDSGGTHIVAEAWSLSGEKISEATAGPGNSLLDFEGTKKNLLEALSQLFEKISQKECTFILAGVAGSESAGNQKELAQFLRTTFEVPAKVISDADLAMLKGLRGGNGLLVIAGTGSIILGKKEKQIYRTGGWGHLLGDEGSAYDIVRRCFIKMTKEIENQTNGPISQQLTSVMGGITPREAITKFYAMDRKEIAALAGQFIAYEKTNATYHQILVEGAQALAAQAQMVIAKIYVPNQPTYIAMTGSVLLNNKIVEQEFEKELSAVGSVEFVRLSGNNAAGINYYMEEE